MVDVREHRQVEVQLPFQLPRQTPGLGRQHNKVRLQTIKFGLDRLKSAEFCVAEWAPSTPVEADYKRPFIAKVFGRMKSSMRIGQKKIWRLIANLQCVRRGISLAKPIDEMEVRFPITEPGQKLVTHLIEGLG
jgi:hypothetical protein